MKSWRIPLPSVYNLYVHAYFTALALNNRLADISAIIASQKLNAAVLANDLATVQELLAAGYPNPNERLPNNGSNWDGYTPLLIATLNGYTNITLALLQGGADVKVGHSTVVAYGKGCRLLYEVNCCA